MANLQQRREPCITKAPRKADRPSSLAEPVNLTRARQTQQCVCTVIAGRPRKPTKAGMMPIRTTNGCADRAVRYAGPPRGRGLGVDREYRGHSHKNSTHDKRRSAYGNSRLIQKIGCHNLAVKIQASKIGCQYLAVQIQPSKSSRQNAAVEIRLSKFGRQNSAVDIWPSIFGR